MSELANCDVCGRPNFAGVNTCNHSPEEHARAAVKRIMDRYGPELVRALAAVPAEPSAGWRGNSSSQSLPSDRRADALSVGLDAEPSVSLTAPQLALLERAVWALDNGKKLSGNIRVFDGRKWPAINKMKLAGLLTVEDYDGRGHHDVITLRATDAARAVVARALSAAPEKSASGPVGELEEHKALSPLVGRVSSVASRGGTASPKSDSGAGH